MSASVLITGGAGYLGSHTALALIEQGYDILVLDNLSNSSKESLNRVGQLTGVSVDFVFGDICNEELLDELFKKHDVSVVLHFAGLKSVGESVKLPLNYYINNVSGSFSLCRAMQKAGVFNLIFSSSATVYGAGNSMPVSEGVDNFVPTNPYGHSKLIVENFLRDLSISDERWRIAILRYFNPGGAHPSGLIGEDPRGIPNNLLPYILKIASGQLDSLKVYGHDYDTRDGTGLRDYIHVMDLAEGHIAALKVVEKGRRLGVWNLGTGNNHSVLEVISAFERVNKIKIPYSIQGRRSGDIAECWADPKLALQDLNWVAKRDIFDILADSWNWQSKNPNGYS